MQVSDGVTIATCGKFHYMNYVPELQRTGILKQFYFSHKFGANRRFGLDPAISQNFPVKEYLTQGHGRLLGKHLYEQSTAIYGKIWERSVLKHYDPAKILHITANGNSLLLLKRARHDGSRIIAEAVNTHPYHRLRLMRDEAERWGISKANFAEWPRHLSTIQECLSADIILCPSEYVANTFRCEGVKTPTIKIPYAANVKRFRSKYEPDSAGTPTAHSGSPLRVLCVGQIGLRKGQLYLLDAMQSPALRNVHLTLVGTISAEIPSRMARFGRNITHIPRVPAAQMPSLMAEHDVLILPSLEEGLAVSICEGMATGLCVIATLESGATEIMTKETGLLVKSRSSQSIVEKLRLVLDSPQECRQIGLRASQHMRASQTWSTYASTLSSIYRRELEL